MQIMELIKYDHARGCFVAKGNKPTAALTPWEELAQVKRPSIFLKDPKFRASKNVPQMVIANPKPFFPYNETLKDK